MTWFRLHLSFRQSERLASLILWPLSARAVVLSRLLVGSVREQEGDALAAVDRINLFPLKYEKSTNGNGKTSDGPPQSFLSLIRLSFLFCCCCFYFIFFSSLEIQVEQMALVEERAVPSNVSTAREISQQEDAISFAPSLSLLKYLGERILMQKCKLPD